MGEPTPDSAAKRTRRKAVSFSFLIQTPDRPARGNHCQPIGLIRHADDTHQLAEHGFAHSRFPGRGGVAGDAICTAIGDAHGEIDHLFRQRIERARRHDFFHARPGAREQRRIVRQIFPEIIDVIDLPRPLDVIEHGADLRTGVAVLDRRSRHRSLPCGTAVRSDADCRKRGQRAQSPHRSESAKERHERNKERKMPKTPDYFAGKTICKIPFHSVHIARNTPAFSDMRPMDAVESG